MSNKEPVIHPEIHQVEVAKSATLEQVKAALSDDNFVKKVHDAFQAGANVQVNMSKVKEPPGL
jgi:hypothetical protein